MCAIGRYTSPHDPGLLGLAGVESLGHLDALFNASQVAYQSCDLGSMILFQAYLLFLVTRAIM